MRSFSHKFARMDLSGIWAAVVTPVDASFEPDCARAAAYYTELLERGCDGINLLGTTGEAMSFSVRQREILMEAIEECDLPLRRIMCGTGATSLADAIYLKRHADKIGFAAALMMPPFFYRDATEDGIMRFLDAVLHDAGEIPVVLYNFPKMSGITYTPSLIERLVRGYPGKIVGIKDSSNSLDYQRDIHARFPALRIFTGSEEHLSRGKSIGIAGCISGSVCLWPQLAHDVFANNDPAQARELEEKRRALGSPLIPAVRAAIARERNDPAWLRSVPPL